MTPIIPNLLEENVSQELSFTNTGIDFTGLRSCYMYVQDLHSTDKICVFTHMRLLIGNTHGIT